MVLLGEHHSLQSSAPKSPGTVLGAHTAGKMDLLPSQPHSVRDKDTELERQGHSRVRAKREHTVLREWVSAHVRKITV